MFVTTAQTEGGRKTIVFHDGKSFFVDEALENNGAIASDPALFFDYVSRAESREKLMEIDPPSVYHVPTPVERAFLPAVNFRTHSSESSTEGPSSPYFFLKFPSALVPHRGTSYIPRGTDKYDYEGEIAIVIGKKGKYLSKAEAGSIVYGYGIVNDLSVRDYQMSMIPGFGKNWVLGKAGDYTLPYGPWVLPASEVDEFKFKIKTTVNGGVRQDGGTEDMIFSVEEMISEISKVTALRPGDIISTGTPSGVALHNKTGFLKDGDIVSVTVPGIGTLDTNIHTE